MGSTREAPNKDAPNKEATDKEAPVDEDAADQNSLYDEDGYPISHSHKNPGEFTTRAEDEPPPSGPGWREVWKGKSKGGWKTYYRDPPSKDKNKDKKPPAKQKSPPAKKSPPSAPSKAPAPPLPARTDSPSTSPSTSPGTKAIEKIEKDFSGDKDWLCLECIIAGLAKGIAYALGAILLLALLPEELAALAAAAMFALMLKGLIDLQKSWGNMSSKEKQEAIAEIIGGLIGGLGGAKFGPKPGSLWGKVFPKAPPVAVTPEGVPMPVPDEGPTGDAPMEARGNRSRGGDDQPDIDRGPRDARSHTPGDHDNKSGAAQKRQEAKQDNIRAKNAADQAALDKATKDLEDLKAKNSQSVMDMILGGKTEAEWIRERQLKYLGRR